MSLNHQRYHPRKIDRFFIAFRTLINTNDPVWAQILSEGPTFCAAYQGTKAVILRDGIEQTALPIPTMAQTRIVQIRLQPVTLNRRERTYCYPVEVLVFSGIADILIQTLGMTNKSNHRYLESPKCIDESHMA